MTTTSLPIDRVLTDSRLLGAGLAPIETWQTWRITLRAAFGEALTDAEREVFKAIAGDRGLPLKRVRELWCIVGRRGGKSRVAAMLACFFACFVKHRLAAGERGMVLVLAATVEQSRVVFGYTLAFLQKSDVLAREIESTTRHEIRLKNGIVIAIHSNSFRSVRGRTLVACIFDEVAYWRDDTTATPDAETYTAVLPALLTTNGMLVGISSPYRRTGLLHAKHKRYFGVDGDDTLVVQGSSKQFNGTLDDAAIAAQQEADPTAARSEWDAQFRDDIAGFLDDALIEQAVDRDRPLELPPRTASPTRLTSMPVVVPSAVMPTALPSPIARMTAMSSTSCAGVLVPSTRRS
jgi:Terminase large subunit, T4likevirus-type, N-terminal